MKAGSRPGPAPRLKKTTRPRPKRGEPHSPWQIMVDDRMRELGVTWRELAGKLSTSKAPVTHTTIWAWTKNTDGYPPTSTYTEEINRKLAAALQMKPAVLAQAYEDARRHLIAADPTAAVRGPLSVLRRLFADSKQTTWTKEEIVNLIDDLSGQ